MNRIRVVNVTRNTTLGRQVILADRWWLRLRGFLGRPEPRAGEGLLMTRCRGVHMWFMRYPLDIVFVDDRGQVVSIYPELQPSERTRLERTACHALELPAGTAAASGTVVGDRVFWAPSPNGGRDSRDDESSLEVPIDILLRARRSERSEVQ